MTEATTPMLAVAQPDILTVAQLAELLGCSEQTVQERTTRRELPGVKYGRDWVYPRAAVLQVLTDQALAHVATRSAQAAPAPVKPPHPLRAVQPAPQRPPQRRRGHNPAPLPDPPAVMA